MDKHGGAALGGAVGPILILTSLTGYSSLRESNTVNRLQEIYPEPKPFLPLAAIFQELTRVNSGGSDRWSCVVNSGGSELA